MTRRQTRPKDRATLRLVAAGALVVASACAAPILATETGGRLGRTAADGVRCGVATDSVGGMTSFRPWVRLGAGQSGSYRFALTGGGTRIDQGGSIDVGAQGEGLLGEATVPGPATAYDVELTVTIDGTLYRCRGDDAEI